MSLIGNVVNMGVDADGKQTSGAFLRARVAIEIDKPLRRGVLLREVVLKHNKKDSLFTASRVVLWVIGGGMPAFGTP